ncbi:hypothetical protein NDU88_001900 [Pleurodeles waltl]|uniref:Uncharacterized protein n=1 Tax=Pleurodeles waltl TaxID=8319 RepID=A0AAV7U8A6_PLEWA|nr:hypothetical protein NDU88_001900 [Pleurodeles waltl]
MQRRQGRACFGIFQLSLTRGSQGEFAATAMAFGSSEADTLRANYKSLQRRRSSIHQSRGGLPRAVNHGGGWSGWQWPWPRATPGTAKPALDPAVLSDRLIVRHRMPSCKQTERGSCQYPV